MATWKELGEVPDSDDESALDSQDSSLRGDEQAVPATISEEDIWDVPTSSKSSGNDQDASQPLTPKPVSPRFPVSSEPDSSPVSALHRPDAADSSITQSRVGGLNARRPYDSIGEKSIGEQTGGGSESVISADGEDVAWHDLARAARSLRPRKPIQEHPYLLEGAQYTTLFRSRGIRPVRLPAEQPAKQKQDEDSQEQDYEEESQSTAEAGPQEQSQVSDVAHLNDPMDDLDELALSPEAQLSQLSSKGAGGTANPPHSSQNDDDELPALSELLKRSTGNASRKHATRNISPKISRRGPARIRESADHARNLSPKAYRDDIFDLPPSPPQTSPAFLSTASATVNVPNSGPNIFLTPKPSSTSSSRSQSLPVAESNQVKIDLSTVDELLSDLSGEDSESSNVSEKEVDVVQQASRRIRGVLPASWLRLDEQAVHQRPQQTISRLNVDRLPERMPRKGVAQRRQVSQRTDESHRLIDHSERDDIPSQQNDHQKLDFSIFEDDAGSAVEEDHIDRMLPGRKRSHPARGTRSTKRRNVQSVSAGLPGRKRRQQKITRILQQPGNETSSSKRHKSTQMSNAKPHSSRQISTTPELVVPARLSIVDVSGPEEPQFIRIAARAAARRPDNGRTTPTSKHINLGTRKDNVDALGVLRDWRRGNIKKRAFSSSCGLMQKSSLRSPLQSTSDNPAKHSELLARPRPANMIRSARFSQTKKIYKQSRIDSSVAFGAEKSPRATSTELQTPRSPRWVTSRRQVVADGARPAQLESTGDEHVGRHFFNARKKALDSLYRSKHRQCTPPTRSRLDRVLDPSLVPRPLERPPTEVAQRTATKHGKGSTKTRSRARKQTNPSFLDTSAPQYSHANDPLPTDEGPVLETGGLQGNDAKLLGLGPFGTQYTQHFEIFPLDPGIFFHESTLLGSGCLANVFDCGRLEAYHRARGHCTYMLGEKRLKWGEWDAQTSSEIGILFDCIVEQCQATTDNIEAETLSPTEMADFILHYIQCFLSFADKEAARSFVARISEILDMLPRRLEALAMASDHRFRQVVAVLSRCIVVLSQTLQVSKKGAFVSETSKLEDVLGESGVRVSKLLLSTDLADIRTLYDEMQDSRSREQGIRDKHPSASGWVILMRVFEEARIPRFGFWDVVSSAVFREFRLNSATDVRDFERLWHNVFTLLPLGEFDATGVAISGLRHTAPLEGWSLPQKLLSRVFFLYKTNSRQSPSFNDYCRSLLSRCHYLVEQWGWRKCNGVIGAIFDFFGSQSLSHLRNEESYRSPEFLEHLAGSPLLVVAPEDRCFHIFLKFLALVIKRFLRFGMLKDVRNLVTRVQPNHDRQFAKEKDLHETDLAALRNHHDLLCVLFWCAPPELRPSAQAIEKLVTPGSSHKEACLVNLRAWNQLARFIVRSGQHQTSWKPFAQWQTNMFQQLLDQHRSVESDIRYQFSKMSKDTANDINRGMVTAIVKTNRQAATDVLHFSLKASVDVIRHAPSLEVACVVMNTFQLEQVFVHFSVSPVALDWSLLRVALDVLEYFVGQLEEFLSQRLSTSPSSDSWQGEDAILLLDRAIGPSFFRMVRNVVGMDSDAPSYGSLCDKSICVRQTVTIAARLAARFVHAGLTRLSRFFSAGQYGVFEGVPSGTSHPSRRVFPLFLATILNQKVVDLQDLRSSRLDLFLCSIVKPAHLLAYENALAAALKRQEDPYLRDVVVGSDERPNYNSNRALFEHMMMKMRKASRLSSTDSDRHALRGLFFKALKAAMDSMKQDLKSISSETVAHTSYMQFVQSIIHLIKSHDFCPVDQFFYEIGKDYSPPAEDPRLQAAAIESCALKLEEGDTRAVPHLFYLLFNNFKIAMTHGRLDEECRILRRGIRIPQILSFILNRMLPAVVTATARLPEAWLLLKVYGRSFGVLFTEACVHKELGEESMPDLLTLVKFLAAGIQQFQTQDTPGPRPEQLYTLIEMIRLLNLVQPSVSAYLLLNANSQLGQNMTKAIHAIREFTGPAEEYLRKIAERCDGTTSDGALLEAALDKCGLFQGISFLPIDESLQKNHHINDFSRHIIEDIRGTWMFEGSKITVRGPTRPQGLFSTQSGQGTRVPAWNVQRLVRGLHSEIRKCNDASGLWNGTTGGRRPATACEEYWFS